MSGPPFAEIAEKHGYYFSMGELGLRLLQHQLYDGCGAHIEQVCPNAWLIQSGNPVFEGCTMMTRETGVKFAACAMGTMATPRYAP